MLTSSTFSALPIARAPQRADPAAPPPQEKNEKAVAQADKAPEPRDRPGAAGDARRADPASAPGIMPPAATPAAAAAPNVVAPAQSRPSVAEGRTQAQILENLDPKPAARDAAAARAEADPARAAYLARRLFERIAAVEAELTAAPAARPVEPAPAPAVAGAAQADPRADVQGNPLAKAA